MLRYYHSCYDNRNKNIRTYPYFCKLFVIIEIFAIFEGMNIKPFSENQKIQDVIEHVLAGKPLREAVALVGLTPSKFAHHLQGDKQAALAYARAVEIKADLMADEVVHLADGDGDPAKVRNQMQARQWLASKLYAKRYGDRIDLNVTQTIDVSATLAEARARLLPRSDLTNIEDAEFKELPSVAGDGASDKQSIAPLPNAVPDIFN